MAKNWTLRPKRPLPSIFQQWCVKDCLPVVQQTSSIMTQSAEEAPARRLYTNRRPNGIGARPVPSFTQVVRQPVNTNSMEPLRLDFYKKRGL